jgi:hypothetical protein
MTQFIPTGWVGWCEGAGRLEYQGGALYREATPGLLDREERWLQQRDIIEPRSPYRPVEMLCFTLVELPKSHPPSSA